jgi:hypothetical protein
VVGIFDGDFQDCCLTRGIPANFDFDVRREEPGDGKVLGQALAD